MTQESILTRNIPQNTNQLQTAKYIFTLPQLEYSNYFVQDINIPTISMNTPIQPTPFKAAYRHGDTLVFDPLYITFMVDEDLRSYESMYKWLISLAPPQNFEQYAKNQKNRDLYQDGVLTLLTNGNVSNIRINFKDCHPYALGQLNFSTKVDAGTVITCTVQMRYDYFTIERL